MTTTDFLAGRFVLDAHAVSAGEDTTSPVSRTRRDTHTSSADGGDLLAAYVAGLPAPLLFDARLRMAAEILDDLENVRKANANRLGAMTRTGPDADGIERGLGLPEDSPAVATMAAMVKSLETIETQATRNLEKLLRAHPLGPWIKAQKGVGDKQAARLLAAVGDPFVNDRDMRPRTVSQLWAYSGLHVVPSTPTAGHGGPDAHVAGASSGSPSPAAGQRMFDAHPTSAPGGTSSTGSHTLADAQWSPAAGGASPAGGDPDHSHDDNQARCVGVAARRKKGQKANWSTTAKTRAWNIVDSCMKQIDRTTCLFADGKGYHTDECRCSPYRRVVDERRQHTAVTHPEWTPAHSLADGKRVAMKALLKDLWREARRIYLDAATPA